MAYPEDRPMNEEDYAMKATEVRKSRLPLSEQDKCIAELQEAANLLVDRLETVLTPQPESPDKAGHAVEGPMQSQMAHELESNNARIRRVTNKLNNALSRLEV